jgi:hypothetical protein
MRRKRLVSMFAIAAVAGALLLGGCGSAATKTPAGGSAAATTPTAGATVHLTDYSDSDGATSTVILTGAVGDFGKAVSIYPNGTINPQHNSELRLALARGSFRISVADLDKQIVSAFRQFPSNTSTCSGTVTATGATPIVAGSGTGSYKGIRGNFNLTATIDEVVSKSTCNASSPFLAEAIVITGSGTVALG